MAVICPAILSDLSSDYTDQINKVKSFASRIQVDLMDGDFVETTSIPLENVWWPEHMIADLHLMYRRPMDYLETILRLRPDLVIVHAEAEIHHMHFAAELHKNAIKAGLAILADTPVANIEQISHSFDHILIFSGHLGHFGGQADLGLLEKVKQIKAIHPDAEIGWDGGVNDQNARALADGGVDVLNAGGFIQKAEDPAAAYEKLVQTLA
jgi:ribulose-phosphate 3-epimerase